MWAAGSRFSNKKKNKKSKTLRVHYEVIDINYSVA